MYFSNLIKRNKKQIESSSRRREKKGEENEIKKFRIYRCFCVFDCCYRYVRHYCRQIDSFPISVFCFVVVHSCFLERFNNNDNIDDNGWSIALESFFFFFF